MSRRRAVMVAVALVVAATVAISLYLTVGRSSKSTTEPAATTTIAQWRFAEGNGDETFDSSGDGHDGQLQSGAAWGPGAPGQSGHSVALHPGARVEVDTATDLDVTGTVAINTWVRLNSGPAATILDKGTYALRISSAGRIGLFWDGRWLESNPLTWANDSWYDLSVVNNGVATTFSRNGEPAGTTPTPGPTATNSSSLLIGPSLNGDIGYLALSSPPARQAPSITGAHLDSSDVTVGSAMTVEATVDGGWSNPDDPTQVDVSAAVTTPSGAKQTADGFMYQGFTPTGGALVPSGTPDWQVRYTPTEAGTYKLALSVQTVSGHASTKSLSFVVTQDSTRGFVEVDPTNHDYYSWSSGQSFFGVGADLDFPEFTKFTCDPGQKGSVCLSKESPTRGLLGDGTNRAPQGESPQALYTVYENYVTAVTKLAQQGANSGRLRLDSRFLPLELDPSFSGIPGYPNGVSDFAIGRYNAANAWIVDQVVSLAAHYGMALQLTTWNADQVPWGSEYAAAKDATLVDRRLRYEVARWGYSPGVLSWELWNEQSPKGSPMSSSFWKQAISYLQSIDINHHVITNSYQGIETDEQHVYIGAKGSFKSLTKIPTGPSEPHNVSEYGQDAIYNDPPDTDPTGSKAHDGEWSALMGERSGAWFWWTSEQIAPENLWSVFHGIAAFTAGEDLGASNWSQGKITANGAAAPESYALTNGSQALVWLEEPSPGQALKVHGLSAGQSYTVAWWNTDSGEVISTTMASANASGAVALQVPSGISGDVAAKIISGTTAG